MNKETFINKIETELENLKIGNRKNFLTKGFAKPKDEKDAELTLAGAQVAIVISSSIDMKYKFYKISEEFLTPLNRCKLIQNIKEQCPGIIFYICNDGSDGSSKTIDTENNMIVFDNENFDAVIELCGGIDKFIETLL